MQSTTSNIPSTPPQKSTVPFNIMQRSDDLASLFRSAGTTANTLARQVGMSASNLSKYLALQVLSEADKSLVRAGQLGFARAYQLAIAKSS